MYKMELENVKWYKLTILTRKNAFFYKKQNWIIEQILWSFVLWSFGDLFALVELIEKNVPIRTTFDTKYGKSMLLML